MSFGEGLTNPEHHGPVIFQFLSSKGKPWKAEALRVGTLVSIDLFGQLSPTVSILIYARTKIGFQMELVLVKTETHLLPKMFSLTPIASSIWAVIAHH